MRWSTIWCSHNLCENSTVPTRIVRTENWIPIGHSDKFVGPTVPTKIVGIANGGFLLDVPTNLSEQYTFYNAAWVGLKKSYGLLCLSSHHLCLAIGTIHKPRIFLPSSAQTSAGLRWSLILICPTHPPGESIRMAKLS